MAENVQVWLVERDYTDKGLVALVYATTDGERRVRMQRSANMLQRTDTTAAIDVEPDRLGPVEGGELRDRYAMEASRMAERHDPDDAI